MGARASSPAINTFACMLIPSAKSQKKIKKEKTIEFFLEFSRLGHSISIQCPPPPPPRLTALLFQILSFRIREMNRGRLEGGAFNPPKSRGKAIPFSLGRSILYISGIRFYFRILDKEGKRLRASVTATCPPIFQTRQTGGRAEISAVSLATVSLFPLLYTSSFSSSTYSPSSSLIYTVLLLFECPVRLPA
jgi:hypothetical protein